MKIIFSFEFAVQQRADNISSKFLLLAQLISEELAIGYTIIFQRPLS